ncbi:MAG: ubiquinol-cytochrome c reductase iron-sulfur subunit [Vicinamibacterales bacterium]
MPESHQIPSSSSTRRAFVCHACQAASLIAVAGLVTEACGGGPTSPSSTDAPALSAVSATVSGRVVSVAVGTGSPLASNGSAALASTPLGAFLIARIGDAAFNVLSATCTHEGCTVTGYSGSRFVCLCHGAQFTTSGAAAGGPASRALAGYASQFANGVLTFTA